MKGRGGFKASIFKARRPVIFKAKARQLLHKNTANCDTSTFTKIGTNEGINLSVGTQLNSTELGFNKNDSRWLKNIQT